MDIIIVGTGKLASELIDSLKKSSDQRVLAWTDSGQVADRSVVVHAGSGRELHGVIAFCERTRSPLLELATGSEIETIACQFPVVLCANTNILMLKFMSMLRTSGHLFSNYRITVTESHQASKTSVAGTAVQIAQSLGLSGANVLSVRDADYQQAQLAIPAEHLPRHAFHQVLIEDGTCTIKMETLVQGSSPYADGVAAIVRAIAIHPLEDRLYDVNEFIENGWT
jgi:4-hydroxy-tetrahydrodipicolinate reductase